MAEARPAVIGCGPAGLAAAVQLQRYGLEPLVFEKEQVGGLLKNANLVENYPGFPGGIPGVDLVEFMKKQILDLGVQVIPDRVACLDYDLNRKEFELQTLSGDYRASHVVIASGTRPRPFLAGEFSPGVEERIFYEVYPLLGERGRQVVIVGAGDAAFDYALNLAGRGNQVTILNRDRYTRCLPLLRERAAQRAGIRYFDKTNLKALALDQPGGRLLVRCGEAGHTWDLMADFILFAIGREPALDFLSPRLVVNQAALTAAGKLFLAGDVKNGLFRQTAIAAGDGLRAAMHIYLSLKIPKPDPDPDRSLS
jgi:thioredoxin reductase (NADPH)